MAVLPGTQVPILQINPSSASAGFLSGTNSINYYYDIAGGTGVFSSNAKRNIFVLGRIRYITQSTGYTDAPTRSLLAIDAYNIDVKLDDGFTRTGNINSQMGSGGAGTDC